MNSTSKQRPPKVRTKGGTRARLTWPALGLMALGCGDAADVSFTDVSDLELVSGAPGDLDDARDAAGEGVGARDREDAPASEPAEDAEVAPAAGVGEANEADGVDDPTDEAAEPGTNERSTTERVVTQLIESELPEGESVEIESVETELIETEPVETEPVETETVETETVETEPVETEPVETELPPTEVVVAQPAHCSDAMPTSETLSVGLFSELPAPIVQQVHPFFEIINETDEPQPIDDLALRYYYSKESQETEEYRCFYVTGSLCSNVSPLFGTTNLQDETASHFMQLTISGSEVQLLPGERLEMRVGFHAAHDELLQSNDYSFLPNDDTNPPVFHRAERVVLLSAGKVIWGIEPCGD